ncbi:DNA-processing protein DprA [Rubrobacter aplysinae]|uniref:DNA-processing protein DprA n=1 Tax=Rubrobacter aplysinae TaxID=909625 RepID=UPI00064BB536|nr:DNA-processing protein DprA [Rubrobacter aplysinae]
MTTNAGRETVGGNDRLREACLLISLVQARTGASLVSRLGETPLEEVPRMGASEVAERARLSQKARQGFEEIRDGFDAREMLAPLHERGIWAVTLGDGEYPERLREIPDPPPALYVDGALPEGPVVSLVGSRRASATGIDNARRIGRALGERGVCVGSGLALGIDAAAHEGALAAGGPAVGVLGCGIDVVYPRKHRPLFEQMRLKGALVSEYYLGEAPLQWRFPARNRVISGLSQAVVVVEAAEKSGALITARHAAESGRDVWAVPGPIGVAECRGSNRLLGDGVGVLWDIPEFLEEIAPLEPGLQMAGAGGAGEVDGVNRVQLDATGDGEPLRDMESQALRGVGFEPSRADEVSRRSGVGIEELLSALSMLELKGYVSRDSAGAFVRRGR